MPIAEPKSKPVETETAPEQISGGHLVAKALKAEGVEVIFTLCGGHIIDIYDGCRTRGLTSSTFGMSRSQRMQPTAIHGKPESLAVRW